MKILNADSDKHRGHLGSGAWTLCVGAGISRGIVPTWNELTRRVVNSVFSSKYSIDEFDKIVSEAGWGLDGWIQAAANEHGKSGGNVSDFYNLIEGALYDDLRENARNEGIEKHLVVALNNPRNVTRDNLFLVCEFFEKYYSNTSLVSLANSLIRTHSEPSKLPRSIITFNADTLLHTLIELFQRKEHYEGPPPHSHPKYFYKTLMRSVGGIPSRKIPIFHCHGAIKPRTSVAGPSRYDSRDKLVFLEQQYLQVATSASTWPETVFMFYAQANTMVFIGLSMSDPNIRRWMATANKIHTDDVEVMTGRDNIIPNHLWFTTNSSDPHLDDIKQVALNHLGIRPVWINGWGELETGLTNLLAVP